MRPKKLQANVYHKWRANRKSYDSSKFMRLVIHKWVTHKGYNPMGKDQAMLSHAITFLRFKAKEKLYTP